MTTKTFHRNVLYYGKEEDLPERIPLRAGLFSLIYEAGDLRTIRCGEREVLRRVYVAIRDRNWGTVPPVLSNVSVETWEDAFRVAYDVENRQGEIHFLWRGVLTGTPDGTIRFTMDGEARSTFLRNRIGFCVLHPIRECAGARVRVEKEGGIAENGAFPVHISPHQPFFDMRSIAHEILPDVWAEVRFAGDVFEMEDQRNWIDASYKTYCTPLRIPYPVEVTAGTRISQSVTLTLRGNISSPILAESESHLPPPSEGAERRRWGRLSAKVGEIPVGKLPRIGLGLASHGEPLSGREIERLRALNLSHLRADLPLNTPACESSLRRAADESNALGVPLEAAIFVSDEAETELRRFAALLNAVKPRIASWLVFHVGEKSTAERWIRLAREHLGGYDSAARFGSGTNAYFTELNRGRPPVHLLDFVTYSVNPQVHAFDNPSLAETLEAIPVTVESARQFIGGLPLAISPVTFKPRFNPDATGPARLRAPGELPAEVDARQMSLFGAGWTLGSLKAVAESGVSSVTYFETTGWRGVMEREQGSPEPFPSSAGCVFPLYHVFGEVAAFSDGDVFPLTVSGGLRLTGLAVRKNGRTRILLANLGNESEEVLI